LSHNKTIHNFLTTSPNRMNRIFPHQQEYFLWETKFWKFYFDFWRFFGASWWMPFWLWVAKLLLLDTNWKKHYISRKLIFLKLSLKVWFWFCDFLVLSNLHSLGLRVTKLLLVSTISNKIYISKKLINFPIFKIKNFSINNNENWDHRSLPKIYFVFRNR